MNMAEPLQFSTLRDEPMAKHVSWRAGGKVDRFFAPSSLQELGAYLKRLPRGEPLLFVGLGSNLLVRDGGFRGTVILMHSAELRPQLGETWIHAPAGVAAPKVARFAATHGFAGAEFLAGIPGTVGGALAMNAGCYGSETWDVVDSVETIDREGTVHLRSKSEFEIGYRHCAGPKDEWFVSARFSFAEGDSATARARIKELLARRVATQPLQLPNAGSVFRNPPGDHAARLIEACGLKGLERGGASISVKHANFIVNPKGKASATDIEDLILQVQKLVFEKKGVQLVPEVRIVGERP